MKSKKSMALILKKFFMKALFERAKVTVGIVCFLVILVLPIQANAMTSQEGADWARNHIGQSIDTDGYYGAQCKDFINAFTQENFNITFAGNANDLITCWIPAGWTRIKNTPDFIPQPGDIALWDYGSYGHTAIILSANINTFVSVDQNWYNSNSTAGSPAAEVTHNYYNGFWGVLRPPYQEKEDAKVTICNLQDNQTIDTVTEVKAKREDGDTNHFAVFYINDQPITGHIGADENGYFSVTLDPSKYSNGNNKLSINYVNSKAGAWDVKQLNFDTKIAAWGIDDWKEIKGNVKLWAKRFDNDSNHYAVYYMDDKPIVEHNMSSDEGGYFSHVINSNDYSEGYHLFRVHYVNSSGGWDSQRWLVVKHYKALEVSLNSNKNSCLENETITLNALADGDYKEFKYRYIVYDENGNKTYLNDTSISDSTYKWTPNKFGSYRVCVEATNSNNETKISNEIIVDVKQQMKSLIISGTINKRNVTIGDTVMISVSASGGSGEYTYNYLMHNKDTDQWSKLTSSFITNNTYTWTVEISGNYEIFIEVKDGTEKIMRASAGNVVAEKPLTISARSNLSSVNKGSKVTITGSASGGQGEYNYSYLIHNKDTDKWSRLTASFIKSNSYTWTAGSAGNREFFVEVKDSTGKVVRSSAVNVTVTDANPLTINARSSASSITKGSKVTITGTAGGGKGGYTYSYLIHNKDTDKWSRLTSSFVTSNTYTWTAGSQGKREFFVEVKDSTGKVVRSSAVNVTVTNANPLTISARSSASSITKGSKVTITGTANGGTGAYTYSYLIHNKDTNKWSRLTSSFVTSNTYTWTAGSQGNREFFVEVKDSTGKVVRSSAVPVSVNNAAPLKITAKSNISSVEAGNKVTLTGTASGGSGGYTYSYLIHNKDTDKWSRLTSSFIKSNSYTWTAGSQGNREFFIEVKDSTGKVVRSSAVAVNVKDSIREQIIGRWNLDYVKGDNGKQYSAKYWYGSRIMIGGEYLAYVEFHKDGTFVHYIEDYEDSEGTYTTEGNTIYLNYTRIGNPDYTCDNKIVLQENNTLCYINKTGLEPISGGEYMNNYYTKVE